MDEMTLDDAIDILDRGPNSTINFRGEITEMSMEDEEEELSERFKKIQIEMDDFQWEISDALSYITSVLIYNIEKEFASERMLDCLNTLEKWLDYDDPYEKDFDIQYYYWSVIGMTGLYDDNELDVKTRKAVSLVVEEIKRKRKE